MNKDNKDNSDDLLQPLVSIGIPTYNRADTLSKAIDSALMQDYNNTEIVISDNASTDETRELCLVLMQQNKKIQYYMNISLML